jgi:hypothetical protein
MAMMANRKRRGKRGRGMMAARPTISGVPTNAGIRESVLRALADMGVGTDR